MVEFGFLSGQVEIPHAPEPGIILFRIELGETLIETFPPMPKCLRLMLALVHERVIRRFQSDS